MEQEIHINKGQRKEGERGRHRVVKVEREGCGHTGAECRADFHRFFVSWLILAERCRVDP